MSEKGGKGRRHLLSFFFSFFLFCSRNRNVSKRYWFFFFFVLFYQQSQYAAIVCLPNKNEIKAFTERPFILLPNAESTVQLLQQLALMILDSFCSCLVQVTKRKEGQQKVEWDRNEISAVKAIWAGIKSVLQRGRNGIMNFLLHMFCSYFICYHKK